MNPGAEFNATMGFIHKKNGQAIILSARNMTPSERRRYEQR